MDSLSHLQRERDIYYLMHHVTLTRARARARTHTHTSIVLITVIEIYIVRLLCYNNPILYIRNKQMKNNNQAHLICIEDIIK